MKFAPRPSPSLLLGPYPEQRPKPSSIFSILESWIDRMVLRRQYRTSLQRRNIEGVRSYSDPGCPLNRVVQVWEKNSDETISDSVVAAADALQKNRALVELEDSRESEESAHLAALAMASTGVPVHLVYDAAQPAASPNLIATSEQLGIRMANLTDGQTLDQRRLAYRADIVLVSFRQLMFDYLLDQRLFVHHRGVISSRLQQHLRGGDGPLLTGLACAFIVDARGVLIDQSSQPMALSDGTADAGSHVKSFYEEAIHCARELCQGQDYLWGESGAMPVFLQQGEQNLLGLTAELGPLWRGAARAQSVVSAALFVLRLQEESDYSLVDGQVRIELDATTQASLGDVTISDFKQLILVKHDLPGTAAGPVISQRLSMQHFFPRYIHLAVSGWLLEPRRRELEKVYELFSVPLFTEQKRSKVTPMLFRRSGERYRVATEILENSIAEQHNILLLGSRQETLDELCSTLDADVGAQLQQKDSAGEMLEVGGLFVSMTMQDGLARAKGQESPRVFQLIVFVDTPSSILDELLVCNYFCSSGECLMLASSDEEIFTSSGRFYRALMPYSAYVYRLLRGQIESLEGKLRTHVAAHDAYVRQTLAFRSGIN